MVRKAILVTNDNTLQLSQTVWSIKPTITNDGQLEKSMNSPFYGNHCRKLNLTMLQGTVRQSTQSGRCCCGKWLGNPCGIVKNGGG